MTENSMPDVPPGVDPADMGWLEAGTHDPEPDPNDDDPFSPTWRFGREFDRATRFHSPPQKFCDMDGCGCTLPRPS